MVFHVFGSSRVKAASMVSSITHFLPHSPPLSIHSGELMSPCPVQGGLEHQLPFQLVPVLLRLDSQECQSRTGMLAPPAPPRTGELMTLENGLSKTHRYSYAIAVWDSGLSEKGVSHSCGSHCFYMVRLYLS